MPDPDAIAARFEYTFARIRDACMREVPILNESIPVKAVGFREGGDYWLGVLITPWFMNLVLSPRAEAESAWPGMTSGSLPRSYRPRRPKRANKHRRSL